MVYQQPKSGELMVWLDRIIFYSLCALIFVLPASTAGVEIFTSLACVFFLVKRGIEIIGKKEPAASIALGIKLPLLAFLGVCGASVLWSQVPQLTVRAFFGKSLMAALLLITVVGTIRSRDRFIRLLQVFLASAFVLCLDGFWQLWSGYDIFKHLPLIDGRMNASMRHPNDLGAYLIFAVLIAMTFVIRAWAQHGGASRYCKVFVAAIGFVILCVGLGLTLSRSAWLGALIGLSVFIPVQRRHVLFCVGALFIFIVIFSPLMTSVRNVSLISDTPGVTQTSTIGSLPIIKDFSGSDRLNIWRDAVGIIRDYPLLGTGLNTYTVMIARYSQYRKLYAHNSYLQMTAELGLVGLGAFLWFLFSLGRFVFMRIVSSKDDLNSVVLLGLFSGWIGFLVESGLDTTFYSVQLSRLMWFMMGLMLAGAMILHKEKEAPGS